MFPVRGAGSFAVVIIDLAAGANTSVLESVERVRRMRRTFQRGRTLAVLLVDCGEASRDAFAAVQEL